MPITRLQTHTRAKSVNSANKQLSRKLCLSYVLPPFSFLLIRKPFFLAQFIQTYLLEVGKKKKKKNTTHLSPLRIHC